MKSSERKISQCILPFIHFCSLFIKSSEDFSASLKGIIYNRTNSLELFSFKTEILAQVLYLKASKFLRPPENYIRFYQKPLNVLRLSTFSVLLGFSSESLIYDNKLTALNYLKFSIQQTKSSGRCLFVVNVIHVRDNLTKLPS